MAANSELLEDNMGAELLETTSPIAPRSLTVDETNITEENGHSGDILDEREDEERNPLLELKKCKEWLQQQKINHEAELLVRKLLASNICTRFVDRALGVSQFRKVCLHECSLGYKSSC